MNTYTSNKYFFSPQQRIGNGGLFIVIPTNQTSVTSNLLNRLRSLATLLNRSHP